MVQGPRRMMRTILAGVLLCTAFAAGEVRAQSKVEPTAEDIARGKALVDAGDCASCHTADPAKPFAGGKRIDTPFGSIYAPNLTPDRETGIGAWSDDAFYRALRFGVAPDGSRYYPAFPYPNFTKLTRQDILAIRAYLATLTPVSNAPRAPELRWPFNYRVVMRGWNWLFFKPGILMPDQQKSAAWNRGRYLVEGVAHCGACHTPKNMFGADRRGRAYGGGRVAGMFAPRLDGAARSGLKSWSAEDIIEYLQSGRNAKSHAGELMSEVVVNSTSKMSDADVRAIAVYLKDLPAGRGSRRSPRPRRRKWRKAKNSTMAPASPATKRTARARRESTRRCPATPTCNPPTPRVRCASSSTVRKPSQRRARPTRDRCRPMPRR